MMISNPWLEIEKNKQKRVSENIAKNIYWAKNYDENYCLLFMIEDCFEGFKAFESEEIQIKSNKNNLLIMLKDTKNWEIFKIFCDDLLNNINNLVKNDDIFNILQERIEEWKKLFIQKYMKILSLEEQMGLFSELSFLKDILLNNKKIDCWRGPEKDLQDFLGFNCAVEIKSSITSKKKIATISSINQLETDKNNLFLIFYSLTQTEKGKTISNLVQEILNLLDERDRFNFQKKVLEIGYNFKEENYFKFIIDSKLCFNAKHDDFPKLKLNKNYKQIIEVKYKIDLSDCKKFEINIDRESVN